MSRAWTCRAAIAAAIVCLAPSAGAEPLHIALIVDTVGGSSNRKVFDIAYAVVGYCPQLKALDASEVLTDAPESVGQRVRQCGSDLGCVSRVLRGADVDRALEIVVSLDLDPANISIRLIDARAQRAIESSSVEVDPQSTTLANVLRQEVSRTLARSGIQPHGRIVVRAEPEDAKVEITPRPPGEPSRTGDARVYLVSPNRYVISARAPGFDDARVAVEATALTDAKVPLQLKEKKSVFSSPWLWVAAGVVVAGAAAGTYVALRPQSGTFSICQGEPSSRCDR